MQLYLLTLFYYSANAILNVVIPLRGESLGASNATIGMIMGSYLLTAMLLRPWAGHVIQKHGPIKVLRAILAVNALALILYAFTGLGGYLMARMLQGACTAFFSMALQLGIINALPDKERSQGISMYSLCSYLPGILGPLLAVGIWQAGELDYIAVTLIAIAIVTGVIGYSANMEPQAATQPQGLEQKGQVGAMLQAIGRYANNPQLFRCSLLMLGGSIVFGSVTTFIPLYAEEVAGGGAAAYLMIQAGVVVASRCALRKHIPSDGKWRTGYMMGIMAMLTAAAASVSYSTLGGAVFFYAGALLMGLAQALLYPTLTTYLSFVSPAASRNVFIGLFIATADLGVSLGSILMGPLADLFSYSTMYMVCAVLGAIMIGAAYGRREPKVEVS